MFITLIITRVKLMNSDCIMVIIHTLKKTILIQMYQKKKMVFVFCNSAYLVNYYWLEYKLIQ